MGLKEKVAEKLGISVNDLMTVITSDIDSTLTITYVLGIIFSLSSYISFFFKLAISEGDDDFMSYNRPYRYYLLIGGPIGAILLLYSIYNSVQYDSLVFNEVVKLAKDLNLL